MKNAYKNMFVRASFLVVTVFFAFMFVSLRLQRNDLAAKAEELKDRIDIMCEYLDELEETLARPFDDKYIEEIAHDELGMRYPQEIVYYSGDTD